MSARVAVDPAIRKAVLGESGCQPRAIKVGLDELCTTLEMQRELGTSDSLAEDFDAIARFLDDEEPCFVLVRLRDKALTVPDAEASDWGVIAWTPDEAPRKKRMAITAARARMKEELAEIGLRQYCATARSDMILEAFVEAVRGTTDADRRLLMTQKELVADEFKREQARAVRVSGPAGLAGLAALKFKEAASFEEAIGRMVAAAALGQPVWAVLGRIAGAGGETLIGETLRDVSDAPALRYKLPLEEPRYAVLHLGGQGFLLVSWLPPPTPRRLKMAYSTLKAAVLDLMRNVGAERVSAAEVSCKRELTPELGRFRLPMDAAEPPPERVGTPKCPRPLGGMALPGW